MHEMTEAGPSGEVRQGYTLHLDNGLECDRDRNEWLEEWFDRIYDASDSQGR